MFKALINLKQVVF